MGARRVGFAGVLFLVWCTNFCISFSVPSELFFVEGKNQILVLMCGRDGVGWLRIFLCTFITEI